MGVLSDYLKPSLACQYLYFAQTEDIWLKSAMEGKSGVSLSTGITRRLRNKPLNEALRKMEWRVPLISNPYFYSGMEPFIKPWKIQGYNSLKLLKSEIGKLPFTKVTINKWIWSGMDSIKGDGFRKDHISVPITLGSCPNWVGRF